MFTQSNPTGYTSVYLLPIGHRDRDAHWCELRLTVTHYRYGATRAESRTRARMVRVADLARVLEADLGRVRAAGYRLGGPATLVAGVAVDSWVRSSWRCAAAWVASQADLVSAEVFPMPGVTRVWLDNPTWIRRRPAPVRRALDWSLMGIAGARSDARAAG